MFYFQFEKEFLESTFAARKEKQTVIEKVANVHDMLSEADGLREQIHYLEKVASREKEGVKQQVSSTLH